MWVVACNSIDSEHNPSSCGDCGLLGTGTKVIFIPNTEESLTGVLRLGQRLCRTRINISSHGDKSLYWRLCCICKHLADAVSERFLSCH